MANSEQYNWARTYIERHFGSEIEMMHSSVASIYSMVYSAMEWAEQQTKKEYDSRGNE